MKKCIRVFVSIVMLLSLFLPNAIAGSCDTCSSCSPPTSSSSGPGGGHPDETFAIDSGFIREGAPPFNSDPSAVTFQNGFTREFTSFIDAYRKVEVKTDAVSTALQLINSVPLLAIPSGGFSGYENSAFFRATLDEFVKLGGTIVTFAQQHRKLPCQADSLKVEFSAFLDMYSAGVRSPRESWGRCSL